MPDSIFATKSADVKRYKDALALSITVTTSKVDGPCVPVEFISRVLGMRRDAVTRSAQRHLKGRVHLVPLGSLKSASGAIMTPGPEFNSAVEPVIKLEDMEDFIHAIKQHTKHGVLADQLGTILRGYTASPVRGKTHAAVTYDDQQLFDTARKDDITTTQQTPEVLSADHITYLRELLTEAQRVLNIISPSVTALPTISAADALSLAAHERANAANALKIATDATLAASSLANNLMEAGSVPFVNAEMEAGKVFISAELRRLGWVSITDLWKDYRENLKKDESCMKQNEFTGLVYWTFCDKLRNAAGVPVVKSQMLQDKMASVLRVRIPDTAAHDRTTALLSRHPKRPGALAIMAATWVFQLWFTAAAREYMQKNFSKLLADWAATGFVKHAAIRSGASV